MEGFSYLVNKEVKKATIHLYDEDTFTSDDSLGMVTFPINNGIFENIRSSIEEGSGEILYDIRCYNIKPYHIGAAALPEAVGKLEYIMY